MCGSKQRHSQNDARMRQMNIARFLMPKFIKSESWGLLVMHMAADRWPAKDGPTLCGWWGEWGCSKSVGGCHRQLGALGWYPILRWNPKLNEVKICQCEKASISVFATFTSFNTWAVTLHWQAKELQWLASLQPGRALARWSPMIRIDCICMYDWWVPKYHEQKSPPPNLRHFPNF